MCKIIAEIVSVRTILARLKIVTVSCVIRTQSATILTLNVRGKYLAPLTKNLEQIHQMGITYSIEKIPTTEQIIELYENSGLPRPTNDKERIKKMYANSNLIITAWENELLLGAARSITDWFWSCYLADLAVRQDYKGKGIGKNLIDLTSERVGEQSIVLLLSVPTAMEYYPKVGLHKVENGFIIHRKK